MDEAQIREAWRSLLVAVFDGVQMTSATSRFVVGVSNLYIALAPLPYPFAAVTYRAMVVDSDLSTVVAVKRGLRGVKRVLWRGSSDEIQVRNGTFTRIQIPGGPSLVVSPWLPGTYLEDLGL